MTVEISEQVGLETLQDKATRLRIDSVRSTTEAGSGHPTSCASAAEIMAVLFYSVMRYDPRDPQNRDSDVTRGLLTSGTLRRYIDELSVTDGGDAEKVIAKFAKAGIDHDQLAGDLQREGTESFVKAWNDLLGSIASKNVLLKAAG
jgi:hypothetical protein